MDISAPYTTGTEQSAGTRGGRGGAGRGAGRNAPKEVSLGMVIDRTSRVHIRNIPLDVIEADGNEAMKPEFAKFGPIDRYVLFSDRTGRFTGAAMCTYRNPADARQAIKELNGRENSDGTKLMLNIAQEHGVVLMRDLNKQRWERQEGRIREGMASDEALGIEEDATPGGDLGPRDRSKKGFNEDGSWSHDMFDKIQRGEPVRMRGGYRSTDYNNQNNDGGRGGRGGGRGGRGRMTMDERFDNYIAQRDGFVGALAMPANAEGGAIFQPPQQLVAPEMMMGGAMPMMMMMAPAVVAQTLPLDMPQTYAAVPQQMYVAGNLDGFSGDTSFGAHPAV